MDNIKTAVLGSNQYLTKFEEDTKKKKRLKIKFKTKVQIAVGLILLASLAANYYFLRVNYVLNCDVVLEGVLEAHAGHLMSQNKCESINQDWNEARSYEASQRIQ